MDSVRYVAHSPVTDPTPLTFPALPGVLRRCSPVVVHDDGTLPGETWKNPPRDSKGVIASDWWEDPVGGWLVALGDGEPPLEWSREVRSWTLSLDLSDQTGVDHLRDWLARTTLKDRRTPPRGSVWYYAGCWRLRVSVGKRGDYDVITFFPGAGCDYRVSGLTAKLAPAEALRLCALHVANEKGLLP